MTTDTAPEQPAAQPAEQPGSIAATGKLPARPFAADVTLEVPMNLFSRTVKRTRIALAQLQPGQVLAVHTDDP